MVEGESFALLGDFFRITYVENRAGVMGISLLPMWLLSLLSIVAALAMGVWLFRRLPQKGWIPATLPWILGGALGNMIDRLVFGSVTDMFDVNIPDIHLPAIHSIGFSGFHLDRWWVFNLADSYIFVCMILLMALSFTGHIESSGEERESKSEAS
jgi:lipoprotein signal peptidase